MLITTWDRIRENRWLSIGLGLAVILGLFFAVSIINRTGAANQDNGYQTAAVERGSLVATIGATGSVRANQSATLNWETSGTVEDVNVEVGDQVAVDERMAGLELTSLPQTVILAQSDLDTAKEQLEDFYESYGELGVTEAAQTLAEAQDTLEDAERNYNYVSSVAPQEDIDQAYANMILEREQLEDAEDAFEPHSNKPEDNLARVTYLSRLAQARQEYNAAVRLYNIYSTPGNPTEVAIAKAKLDLANAQLEEAQADYESVINGPNSEEIAAAEARVAAAQATLDQAYIAAPFAGTVTDAFPIVGDLVTTGQTAFKLDDLSRLLVDVEVSEVDINRVAVGQAATLTFDAVPDKEYSGEVVAVALSGTVEQGAVNFRVTVELSNPDEAVRPGMTAVVNIVVTELEEVLVVPNRAVRVVDGERVVYLQMENGQLGIVQVTLGASSENYSEVLAGDIEPGDIIVLNPPSVSFDPAEGPPPAFIRGGGGGFQ